MDSISSMSLLNKILTTGGAVIATVGVSLGAVEGNPGLLLFVLGVFRDIKSELQTPVFVGWWK